MADLLKNVLEYLKVKKEVTKDNVAFRIVTVGSFGIFMMCAFLNGLTLQFGDPIICKDRDQLMETNCWYHGSYDLNKSQIWNKNCLDKETLANQALTVLTVNETKPEPESEPGMPERVLTSLLEASGHKVRKLTRKQKEEIDKPTVRTKYYQWVVCALVLSAILFRLPAWIWSILERGLMANFYNSNQNLDVLRADKDEFNHLASFEVRGFRRLGRWTTITYYLKFLACQCLALLVWYLTFHGTDKFLDGRFATYGSDVMFYYYKVYYTDKIDPFNPMCNTFPTRVACKLTMAGTSGGPSETNSYCILTQNIINEKIYLALWFWFGAIYYIIIAQLIWEVCFLIAPLISGILGFILPSASRIFSKYHRRFLILGTRKDKGDVAAYLPNLSFGEVFVLYQLEKNIPSDFFYEMLLKLSVNEQEAETETVNEQEAETEPMLPKENGVEINSVVTSK